MRNEQGQPTQAATQVLAHQLKELAGIWNAKPNEPEKHYELLEHPAFKEVEIGDRVSVDALRQTAGSFRWKTCTPDGMHPRLFGELSEQGLEVMSTIFLLCEMCGQMPWQISDVPVNFIDKPTGGVRGIGSNRAFSRVWQRSRRQHVRTWEAMHGMHPAFSVCKGRSCTEAIWRQSVKAEAGSNTQKFVCLLLWDLRKCFEYVVHFKLIGRSEICQYPMWLLRLSLAQARWPRLLSVHAITANPVWPDGGIVPGGAFSTYELKAYFLWNIEQHVIKHNQVGLNIHVDDFAQQAVADTRLDTVNLVESSARDLMQVLQEDLNMHIALDKSSVTTNDELLANMACDRLHKYAGVQLGAVRNLGIDSTAGKGTFSPGMAPTRRARERKAGIRRRRLLRLKVAKAKRARIYVAGNLSVVGYGLEVTGIMPGQLAKIRSTAARTMGITKQGFSMEIAWASSPRFDPLSFAAKGLVQYCMEWWKSTYRVPGALTPPELVSAFESARTKVTADGRWAQECTGPLTVMIKWVLYAGWALESATRFKDQHGKSVQILYGAPQLVGKKLVDALRDKFLMSTVTESLDRCQYEGSAAEIREHGLWLEPMQTLVRSKRKGAVPKYFAKAVWAGAVSTNEALHRWGYQVTPNCRYCLGYLGDETTDSLHHRAFVCPHGEEVRKQHISPVLLREAISKPRDPLFARGWLSYPHWMAKASEGEHIEHLEVVGNKLVEVDPFKIDGGHGVLFSDGSCLHPRSALLARAGFAVVQLHPDGSLYRVLRGRVPGAFQQSAVISEHYAVAYAANEVSGLPLLYGDCQAVVTGWKSFKHCTVDPRAPMAGFWRVCSEAGWPYEDIVKIKAHQNLQILIDSGASEHELFLVKGNQYADVHAGIAAMAHLPPAGDLAAIERIIRDWRQVMDVFMNVLPLWPPASEVHGKLLRARQAVGRAVKQRHVHNFVWSGQSYRCMSCFREKRTSRNAVDKLPCGTFSNSVRKMVAVGDQLGHRLFMAHGVVSGMPVVFCGACAAMVTTRAVNLVSPCSRVPCNGWQRTALGLFHKRLHPKTREPLTQPWPYASAIFQCSVAGVLPPSSSVDTGEPQDDIFGPGSGGRSVGGEGSGVLLPSGDCSVGTLAAPWDLPAGLAGDESSDGEG